MEMFLLNLYSYDEESKSDKRLQVGGGWFAP